MGDGMNWFAFFSVFIGVPVLVCVVVGLFHIAAFIAELCPWWVPALLILLITAAFFGMVVPQ